MKRFRILGMDFDTRATILALRIEPEWSPDIQEMHQRNKVNVVADLLAEFGSQRAEAKVQDYQALGPAPFSVLAFHNKFLRQIRNAFVIGAYYPALTSACALGERLLNHLLINLREDFRETPEYKRVYRKNSFPDWGVAIDTLEAWGVLLPSVVTDLRKLQEIRNQKAIHFNPETDQNEREFALEAINTLQEIIGHQFSAFGTQPWFIPNVRGCSFIKREAEDQPFVREVYLPNAALVGPYHQLEFRRTEQGSFFVPVDNFQYEDRDVTDEAFVELFNAHRHKMS